MKKLFFALFLMPFLSYSQQLINHKDPFTGKTTKMAVVNMGSSILDTRQMFSFGVAEDKKIISFVWTTPSGTFGAFNSIDIIETSIMIKLDSDSIFIFKADPLISKLNNVGNTSILAIQSYISDEQLKKLSQQTIINFKIGIKNGAGVDFEGSSFTKKNREQIKKAALFMIN